VDESALFRRLSRVFCNASRSDSWNDAERHGDDPPVGLGDPLVPRCIGWLCIFQRRCSMAGTSIWNAGQRWKAPNKNSSIAGSSARVALRAVAGRSPSLIAVPRSNPCHRV